jgi:hypothetical protein
MGGLNKDDIDRMARKVGFPERRAFSDLSDLYPRLERFANLVAAAERERIRWDTIHSCHPECDKPVCVAIRKAVAEEREACIEAARTVGGDAGAEVEKLIRARGQG